MGVVDLRTRRVLVYRLGSLGDTLIAVPALRLIRRTFPRAEVRLLTNRPVNAKAPAAATVLEGSGLVDGYVHYPVGTRRFSDIVPLWWTLFRWRPEVVIYLAAARGMKAAKRDRRFFRLCGVHRFLGFPLTATMQSNCYGVDPQSETAARLTAEGRLEPEAARLTRNLASLGDAELEKLSSWSLALSAEERSAAANAIGEDVLQMPILAVCLGTKVQAKDWGEENWHVLLWALGRRYPGHALLLAGAPEERAASERARQGWSAGGGGPVVNLCGRLTPRESAAALGHARLFLGHDSGPMHLAASVGTPCVAIFSARNLPRQWFPFGEQHRVLYRPVECRGCGLETCTEQRKKCLQSIRVEDVLCEVERALSQHAPQSLDAKDAMMEAHSTVPAALQL